MLSKEYRLPTKDIANIAKRGKRLSSELFDIRCWWDDALELPLFAFAVGLKVSKSAVVRNTIKRKFRAAIYGLLKTSHIRKGKYLIIAKTEKLQDLKSDEIEIVISKLLNNPNK